MTNDAELRVSINTAARALARLGYLHAFGHISVRTRRGLLITPTKPPFLLQGPGDVLAVDPSGSVLDGDGKARPIEVFLHLAIYERRADVNAICRTHAPHASAVQSQATLPPIRHGFGGIAEKIAVFDEIDLIHDPEIGGRAADGLAENDGLILRGNGVLTVGETLAQAAARMWSLEERCIFDRLTAAKEMAFTAPELAARKRWYGPETGRIWSWLEWLGRP